MPVNILLSEQGCDRATAYHMSNKIVRHRDGLFVTWLDAQYRVILARLDEASGQVLESVALARGMDNHCGAALALTPDGALQVMAGNHANGGFIHRSTTTPRDPASWSLPFSVGCQATYPSMISTAKGTLLLTHRGTTVSGPWAVHLHRQTLGGEWSWRLPLAEAPAPLYTFTTHCLTVGPDGTVHLVIEFYKTFPNNTVPAHTTIVTHLYSPDDGVNWYHDDGRLIKQMPIGVEDCAFVAHDPAGDLRPGDTLALADGRLLCGIHNSRTGVNFLQVRDQSSARWRTVDLTNELLVRSGGLLNTSQLRLTLDTDGSIMVVTTVSRDTSWSSAHNQLIILWLDPATLAVRRHELIPQETAGMSNWLASVEREPNGGLPRQTPLILFTEGNRGEGCKNDAVCRVRLLRLS